MDSARKLLITTVVIAILISTVATVRANDVIRFNVVENNGGNRHISIIPKSGYDENGEIKDGYNPNSIVFQHAQMVRELLKEDREIMLHAEEENSAVTDEEEPFMQALPEQEQARTPGDIFSGEPGKKPVLDELIELEKQAGRTKPKESP